MPLRPEQSLELGEVMLRERQIIPPKHIDNHDCTHYTDVSILPAGSRYFCESFYGIPAQQAEKSRDRMPAAAPAGLLHRRIPSKGYPTSSRNDSTDVGKPAFSLRPKSAS